MDRWSPDGEGGRAASLRAAGEADTKAARDRMQRKYIIDSAVYYRKVRSALVEGGRK